MPGLMFEEEWNNNGIWNWHCILAQIMLRKLTDCFHPKIRSATSNIYSNKSKFSTLSSFWRCYKVVVAIKSNWIHAQPPNNSVWIKKSLQLFSAKRKAPAINYSKTIWFAKPEISIRKRNFNLKSLNLYSSLCSIHSLLKRIDTRIKIIYDDIIKIKILNFVYK